MNNAELQSTIVDANNKLSPHRHLRCFAAWRSIGSNIFLEFGTPVAKQVRPKTRSSFTVLRGECSVGIHGDSWLLLNGADKLLDSSSVDEVSLEAVAQSHLRGSTMPILSLHEEGRLMLHFGCELTLLIGRNEHSTEPLSIVDEVTINVPGAALSFTYERGVYLAPA